MVCFWNLRSVGIRYVGDYSGWECDGGRFRLITYVSIRGLDGGRGGGSFSISKGMGSMKDTERRCLMVWVLFIGGLCGAVGTEGGRREI